MGLAVTGGAGAVVMLAAGCSGDTSGAGELASDESKTTVTITPANGTTKVKPDGTIEVKVADGTLQKVTVQGEGSQITGKLSSDRSTWRSDRTMTPDTRYTVTAVAADEGKTQTATSSFSTLDPAQTLEITDVTPNLKGEEIGVGAPIIVSFNRPVQNRAAVEKVLEVTPEKAVEGAWRWVDDKRVIYRTKTYWEPHQKIKFEADLAGLNVGGGVYGEADEQATLTVGAEQITKGDIGEHHMTVYRDGKKLRTIPFSAGNGTTREYTTTSGVHLLMGKENPVTMVSPGRKPGDPGYYKTVVNHGVRFSNSGEYTHAMASTVGVQGSANVSHGCLNLSPKNAKWYYDIMQRGDVLKLTGSDRDLEPDNGWGYWQLSFSQWKEGSALH
ncbi:hypothetical protein GCM10010182_58250 [Actinomadura cremea]|nr:hypothetical protein GCM10010182_58250 [Actinomadura cremea]